MGARFADRPGAAVEQNAAVETVIEGLLDLIAQASIGVLKALWPAVFKRLAVVVHDAIEHLLGRSSLHCS